MFDGRNKAVNLMQNLTVYINTKNTWLFSNSNIKYVRQRKQIHICIWRHSKVFNEALLAKIKN